MDSLWLHSRLFQIRSVCNSLELTEAGLEGLGSVSVMRQELMSSNSGLLGSGEVLSSEEDVDTERCHLLPVTMNFQL